ncbi:hypothetical protein ASG52_13985 [Methylobacterium sp. Leaf456]|uniref:hypothetical protein n=1 Tax=Methylobacterium sp. Leaf456 TaxID=1736382 RepID=UPI0006F9301B|nr:hypothetical protein [Methylobacterium sp. Leaf456]KQT46805.1 hypothetical protein ASG52_13985 [Methylobacterium sp. Leaf456]
MRGLLAALLLLAAPGARAQSIVDGSAATVGPPAASTILVLVGRQFPDPEARIAGLRKGRDGAVCGTVDVRNRMGTHAGPRPFVADLSENFFARLPEGPELRSPASPADFKAMQRAKALYEANCTAE